MIAGPPIPIGGASGGSRPGRAAVALVLAIDGDLRFLSHHDERRWLVRALVRAGWPLAYSAGFNPQPRLSLPLPRSVGLSAGSQLACVQLREPREPRPLFDGLGPHLPSGCDLRCVLSPTARQVPQPQRVTYELDLDAADAVGLEAALTGLLTRPTLIVARDRGPDRPRRTIDIRPYIKYLELDGCRLCLVLEFKHQRTARPSEIITELGLAAEAYQHRLRRTDVQWDHEPTGPAYGPAAIERT